MLVVTVVSEKGLSVDCVEAIRKRLEGQLFVSDQTLPSQQQTASQVTIQILSTFDSFPARLFQPYISDNSNSCNVNIHDTKAGADRSGDNLAHVTKITTAIRAVDFYLKGPLTLTLALSSLRTLSDSASVTKSNDVIRAFKSHIAQILSECKVHDGVSPEINPDFCLQLSDVWRRSKRLVVFDMDSTLIEQEVIDEIARDAGIGADVAAITESAMRGELDFQQSLRRRVGLLRGASAAILEAVKARITITPGARELCRALRRLGFKLAVVSGGFIPLARYIQSQLHLDHAFANELEVEDGKFTGGLTGPIVDGPAKAEHLKALSKSYDILLSHQSLAVGDGANDLWMMKAASLGVAFNAKPRVQEQADATINQRSLHHLLYFLGYGDEDLEQLLHISPSNA